ncbi:MAG: hypothetical protein PHE88_11770 [Elusimicrobia bacterium]|nr:hypothetical protein [Elusimicrobiota bacterium]
MPEGQTQYDKEDASGQSASNVGLDIHDLLMSCGAAKLTILGLQDIYAVRTEQMQQIIEKIKSHYGVSNANITG